MEELDRIDAADDMRKADGAETAYAQRMASLADEFATCRTLLAALGDTHRQLIFLDLLRHWGGLRTCEIASHVGLSRATVSHHLGMMKKAGVISVRRVGTERIYHPSENAEPWSALAKLACAARRFVGDLEREGAKEQR